MPTSPRILMAAGGTGGHVYPAIAIADAVQRLEPDAAVEFAGTRDRMEWEAVPKAGYAINPITVSGIQRKLTVRNLTFPFKLAKGLTDSWKLVGEFDPDVVVGTGGYVSGPVLLAASLRGRPVVIQEQNAYAGLTNRLLARRAEHIHIAFPETTEYVPAEKCMLSGNPTRKELRGADRTQARTFFGVPSDALMLFVFGGSLGSEAINAATEHHLDALLENDALHVLWQTGERYYERLSQRVPDHERLHLQKYIDRMDYAYAATDIALCRAGALTCSELMVTGTPAVLVPSPNVTEDHQTRNARSMTKADAALMLPEPELDTGFLDAVRDLLEDGDRRRTMRESALEIARPDAADDIARDVLRLAGLPEYQ